MKMNNRQIGLFLFLLLFINYACVKNGNYWEPIDGGLECVTFNRGHLSSVMNYLEDSTTKDGPFYKMDTNGDTLVKGAYRHNKLIGSYYEYYSKGRPKKYFCFDSFYEDTMYVRIYDSSGKILREWNDTDLFYNHSYTETIYRTLDKDSMVKIWSIIVLPPKTKFSVNCVMVNVTKKDSIYPIGGLFLPYQNNLIYTTLFKLKEQGKYQIFVTSKLIDSSKRRSLNKVERITFPFPM